MDKFDSPRIPSTSREIRDFKSMLGAGFDLLQKRYESSEAKGLLTGFKDLDDLIGEFQPEELIVVGGRPSSGKSIFALNVCQHIAICAKRAVAIFSLEMSEQRIIDRMIASLGRIDLQRLRSGELWDEEWARVASVARQFKDAPLLVDCTPALTPEALYSKVAVLKEERDVALVVVDYVHLMQVPDSSKNEAEQLAEISRSLKAMAKELRITVMAISQLNRSSLYRFDRRPQLADLRGAGSLEDDADAVILLHHLYQSNDGRTEVIVGKQRHGVEGSIQLRFFGEYARFGACPGGHAPMEEAKCTTSEDTPINEEYISKALDLGLSKVEMLAFLEQAGLVVITTSGWEATALAKPYLHPTPDKGRKWHRSVIALLRSRS